jgi:hypothetical protein
MIDKKQIKREVLITIKKRFTKDGMPESFYDWRNIEKKFAEEVIDEVLSRI